MPRVSVEAAVNSEAFLGASSSLKNLMRATQGLKTFVDAALASEALARVFRIYTSKDAAKDFRKEYKA